MPPTGFGARGWSRMHATAYEDAPGRAIPAGDDVHTHTMNMLVKLIGQRMTRPTGHPTTGSVSFGMA
ncbi:MAG: hypothetical protein KJ687_00440 [Proteobacteria bacterium]|nr:hypothetical protein [Pseudomonadota bacterium]